METEQQFEVGQAVRVMRVPAGLEPYIGQVGTVQSVVPGGEMVLVECPVGRCAFALCEIEPVAVQQ